MARGTIGVVGAGTMGSGIAQLAAQNDYDVVMRDLEDDIVREGLDRVEANLREAEERDIIEDAAAAFARVEGTTDLEDVVEAPLVVEAVVEEMDLKQEVFAELDDLADEETVLGSNTSSLSITEIASATDHPERVVGVHFFNPPVKMKLVELVTGHHTSDRTVAVAEEFCENVGHESILVDDFPGFATSRLSVVLGMEAARMVQEGVASAEDIDKAARIGYNHPMGPLELGDYNGWDVRVEVGEYLAEELGRSVFKPPQILKKMVRGGDLGVKTGQGFYDWDETERQ